jgi:hypothetical protein
MDDIADLLDTAAAAMRADLTDALPPTERLPPPSAPGCTTTTPPCRPPCVPA